MGHFGENMGPLSSQAPLQQRAYLYIRARNSGLTKSEAMRVILNFWLAMGAPALTDHELDQVELPAIPEDAKAAMFETTRATFERIPAYWESLFPMPTGDRDPVGPRLQAGMRRRGPKAGTSDVRSSEQ